MPTYTVTDPRSKRTVTLRGDSPPTEAELHQIFAQINSAPPTKRGYDPLASYDPAMLAGMAEGEGRAARDVGNAATQALPTVGGIAGGFAGSVGGPVGAAAGATLGGAAGEAGRQVLSGEDIDPKGVAVQGALQGATEGLGGVVTKAAPAIAKSVYRGFLKPSISARMAPKANQIVQTALEEALPITRGGAQTGQRVINELRTEVSGILSQAQGSIDLHSVAERVRAFAKRKYFKPGADQSDYKAALAVADRLDQHPSLGLPPGAKPTRVAVSPAVGDETKRALDASVGDAGFGVKTGAQRTTEKFARREVRGDLEGVAPTIAPLNARESKLIDATRAISQAVERESNRNAMFGVPSIMAGAMGGAEYARGGDPASAAAMALAARAGMHPAVASRIAITAYRLSKELGVAASTAARLAVAVASEQTSEQEPEQQGSSVQ